MSKHKTDAEFKQGVFSLVKDEYVFLDSYVNNVTKLRVKHSKCGNIYMVTPNSFLKGNRCPYCSSSAKKTDAQFKHEVKNLVGEEYTFLDAYVGGQVKLKVKHNKCGNTYRVTPSNFISHHNRCPYCSGCVKKTNIQFKKEVYDLVGSDYVFLEPYVNAKTKIRVKHNKCGHIYKIAPIKFIGGNRCPYCNNEGKTKTNTQFKKEVYGLVGNEYVFLDTYVNDGTKLRVKHIRCGNVYKVTPSHFIQGERCPYCNIPHGEDLINKILKSLGIKYEYQKIFADLKDVQPLSYDFYVPYQNILIEYQGRQHYQAVDYFGGDGQFKVQQEHDKMKANYAKANGYNLIAVPYTEDTFSKIKKYLIKHGLK